MSAETRSSVGRHELTSISADTRPILHRHSAATRPPLGRPSAATRPPLGCHSADTSQTLGQQYAHLVSSLVPSFRSIFSALLREAFSGRCPFLAFNSGNIHVFFPAMFFSSSSLLYTTLVTFGCNSIWGLLLFAIDWTLRDMFV